MVAMSNSDSVNAGVKSPGSGFGIKLYSTQRWYYFNAYGE